MAGERAVLRARLRAALRLASAAGLLDGVLASPADSSPPGRTAVWGTLDEVVAAVYALQVVLARRSVGAVLIEEVVARRLYRDGQMVPEAGVLGHLLPAPLPPSAHVLVSDEDYFVWLADWLGAAVAGSANPTGRTQMATLQADAAVRHVLRLVQLGSMGLDAALILAGVDPPRDPEARRQALSGLCKGVTEALLPDALSGDFTRLFFSATDRRRVARLSRQVQAGVLDTLRSTFWLHPRTRREIMRKMAVAKTYAGGPRLPYEYADVVIPRGLSNSTYADGLVSVGGADRRRLWAALYHPAAADAWRNPNFPTFAFQADVAYTPLSNALYVHAAMIGWPVFPTSPALAGALPDAIEYGALGSLIGHENGHGLDTRESL